MPAGTACVPWPSQRIHAQGLHKAKTEGFTALPLTLLHSLPPVLVLPLLSTPFVHPQAAAMLESSGASPACTNPSRRTRSTSLHRPGAGDELQPSTRGRGLTQEDDEDPSQLGPPVLGRPRLVAHPDAGQDCYQQEDSRKAQDRGGDHQRSTCLDIPCWQGKG